mgnify:FL=1
MIKLPHGWSRFLLPALVLVVPTNAHAVNYETKTGTINKIEINAPVASGRNVLISLNNVSPMCNLASNNTTAYFNKADNSTTFQEMLSLLMTARASQTTVTLLLTNEGAEGCRIDRASVQ